MSDLLPLEAIKEFQNLYKQAHGDALSENEAKKKAEDFIQLFDLVTTPNQNKYENSRSNIRVATNH